MLSATIRIKIKTKGKAQGSSRGYLPRSPVGEIVLYPPTRTARLGASSSAQCVGVCHGVT